MRGRDEIKAPALAPSKPIAIRKNKHLNNRIEQDHRRIKRRMPADPWVQILCNCRNRPRPLEMVQMMRKRQARFAFNPNTLAEGMKNRFDLRRRNDFSGPQALS
jgi:putative transposase